MARRTLAVGAIGATLVLAFHLSPSISASPLEGTRWDVNVTPDDAAVKKGEKAFDDTIIFENGKVSMSECLKYGFLPSDYTVTQSGENWTFRTQQTSDKEGKNSWQGEISGESIKGALVWTKKDGTVVNYTFTGKKEAK